LAGRGGGMKWGIFWNIQEFFKKIQNQIIIGMLKFFPKKLFRRFLFIYLFFARRGEGNEIVGGIFLEYSGIFIF
jgi:hypothetical protein